MALGVPDDLFWRSSPAEVDALLREIIDLRQHEQRAAALRAGLIAAMIANCRHGRPRGSRSYRPEDFVGGAGARAPLTEEDVDRLQRIASGEILMRPD